MSKLVKSNEYEQITDTQINNISKYILENLLKDYSRYCIANQQNVIFSESASLVAQNTGTDYNIYINPFFVIDSSGTPIILTDQVLQNISIPTTNNRVDIIQAELGYTDENAQSRQFIDPLTGNISSVSTYTEFGLNATISVKQGTEAGSPVAPTVDSGKVKIAEIYVDTSGGIANADIYNVDSDFGEVNTGWTTQTTITTLLKQLQNHRQSATLDHPDGSVTLAKLNNDVKNTIHSVNDIVDPMFDFWSAGNTAITGVPTATYITDMIRYSKSGTMVHDSSRYAITKTANIKATYAVRLTPTTAQGSFGASDLCVINTRIEGYNIVKYLINGNFTFSIIMRSVKTGTFCIGVKNSGGDRAYVVEKEVTSSDTWEKYTVTIPFDETIGGTWDYTNGEGLILSVCLGSGSSFQTTPDSWQNGNFFATSNQDNFCDSLSNVMYFTELSCGAGTQEIGFDNYDITLDNQKLKRNYYRIDGPSSGAAVQPANIRGEAFSSSICRFSVSVPVCMRDSPDISFVNALTSMFDITAGGTVTTSLSSISNIEVIDNVIYFYWNDNGTPFTGSSAYTMNLVGINGIIFDDRF